jgi:hypothetical protein
MTERSFQDAVQVLKERLGSRWEGVELDGRDEMVSILKDKLGYDKRAANDAIDAMIESGTLRYPRGAEHSDAERRDDDDIVPPVLPVAAGTAGAGSTASGGTPGGGLAAVPLVNGDIMGGYWEIGPGESDVPGRAGQVTPR